METLTNVITAAQLDNALKNENADKVVRISYRHNSPDSEDIAYPKFLLSIGVINGKEFTTEKSVWSFPLDSGSAFKKPVSDSAAHGDITVRQLRELLQDVEADAKVFLDGGSWAPALYSGHTSGIATTRHLTNTSLIWKN
jgi:hypothetical protein